MMLEENKKAKIRLMGEDREIRSEGQQLVEKLKKKTTDGIKKKHTNLWGRLSFLVKISIVFVEIVVC